ncbi:MAG: DNA repair protein RecO [Clostridia bacterium]
MEIKTRALCIKAMDYKEKDKLLTLVTLECGKITAIIRSAKSPTSKLKMAASPLCFGEYILNKSNGRHTVIGCTIEDNFFNIWNDINRYAAAEIVLEVLDKAAYPDNECGEELVTALKAIAAINYAETHPYLAAVWFIIKIFPALGIDTAVYELPERARLIYSAIEQMETEDLDAQDWDRGAVYEALYYINLIFQNALSDNLRSIPSALKLIGG